MGLPQVLRTDTGPNAYIERFSRTYRYGLLDRYLFATLDDVREATFCWVREYNEE